MSEGVSSYMTQFADGEKLDTRKSEYCESLQNYLNKIWNWSKKWEMEFHVKKCLVMEMGKK